MQTPTELLIEQFDQRWDNASGDDREKVLALLRAFLELAEKDPAFAPKNYIKSIRTILKGYQADCQVIANIEKKLAILRVVSRFAAFTLENHIASIREILKSHLIAGFEEYLIGLKDDLASLSPYEIKQNLAAQISRYEKLQQEYSETKRGTLINLLVSINNYLIPCNNESVAALLTAIGKGLTLSHDNKSCEFVFLRSKKECKERIPVARENNITKYRSSLIACLSGGDQEKQASLLSQAKLRAAIFTDPVSFIKEFLENETIRNQPEQCIAILKQVGALTTQMDERFPLHYSNVLSGSKKAELLFNDNFKFKFRLDKNPHFAKLLLVAIMEDASFDVTRAFTTFFWQRAPFWLQTISAEFEALSSNFDKKEAMFHRVRELFNLEQNLSLKAPFYDLFNTGQIAKLGPTAPSMFVSEKTKQTLLHVALETHNSACYTQSIPLEIRLGQEKFISSLSKCEPRMLFIQDKQKKLAIEYPSALTFFTLKARATVKDMDTACFNKVEMLLIQDNDKASQCLFIHLPSELLHIISCLIVTLYVEDIPNIINTPNFFITEATEEKAKENDARRNASFINSHW